MSASLALKRQCQVQAEKPWYLNLCLCLRLLCLCTHLHGPTPGRAPAEPAGLARQGARVMENEHAGVGVSTGSFYGESPFVCLCAWKERGMPQEKLLECCGLYPFSKTCCLY